MTPKQPEHIFCTYTIMYYHLWEFYVVWELPNVRSKNWLFFQNWTSMLRGLNENVLKMMIIFKNGVYFNHFAVYSASWDLIQGL